MHLEYKFDTKEIQNNFRKLSQLGKTDGLTRKIANVLWQETETAFENERSPDGDKWAELSGKRQKWRQKTGYNGKKLQVTGDLLTSLNLDYGENFSRIGASEHYAQYHQVGTKYISARQFLGISNDGIEEIKAILYRTLKQTIQD